jgi:hypothetical protein
MRAKKVYEFQQGGDPYETMGLSLPQVGDKYRANYNLVWDFQRENWFERKYGESEIDQDAIYFIILDNTTLYSGSDGEKGYNIGTQHHPTEYWINLKDLKHYFKKI